MARSCTAKGSLIRPKPSQPPGRLSSCFGREAALAVESGGARPSLIFPLEPPSILEPTMESLEVIVLPVILMGALLLGAIWTTLALHWLRSTEPLQ